MKKQNKTTTTKNLFASSVFRWKFNYISGSTSTLGKRTDFACNLQFMVLYSPTSKWSDIDNIGDTVQSCLRPDLLTNVKPLSSVIRNVYPLQGITVGMNLVLLFYPRIGMNRTTWGFNRNTVKPLLSGHLRDLPKCALNRGCPLSRGCKNCVMFVNDFC